MATAAVSRVFLALCISLGGKVSSTGALTPSPGHVLSPCSVMRTRHAETFAMGEKKINTSKKRREGSFARGEYGFFEGIYPARFCE